MYCNIYVITNLVNGKKYVGKTVNTLRHRWSEHVHDASIHRYNSTLHKAIRKYGPENFSMELIEKCDEELSNEREQYWIKEYDTYKNGYNSTLGGDGKPVLEIPDREELNNKIHELGLNKTAKHYGVYVKTLHHWIELYKINIRDIHVQTAIRVGCTIDGKEMQFDSLNEAGKFVTSLGITDAKDSRHIGYNIKRAIERNGSYLGIKWRYI